MGKEADGPVSSWQRWALRGVLAVVSPCVVLGLLECLMWIMDIGYPAGFLLPADGGKSYVPNDRFAYQFYGSKTLLRPVPFKVVAQKPDNSLRIVLLGESAAAGTPDPAYGFGRILETMLRGQFPNKRVEVINAAMRGVNSHIIRVIAQDCARLQPDLYVVYMGNNEVIGLYAPDPKPGLNLPSLRFLRVAQWFRSTRLGQCAQPLLVKWTRDSELENPNQDMAFFRAHRLAYDDPKRQTVYAYFRQNLADICQTARRSGSKMLLSTVAVNLKDFPPLASLHRADLTEANLARWTVSYTNGVASEAAGRFEEAVAHYLKAAEVDDHFADLQYRLARCYWRNAQYDAARERFSLARDRDALQFRADAYINEAIRGAARPPEVTLIDAEQILLNRDVFPHKILGDNLFYEYVHFRWAGDYLMARTLFPKVIEILGTSLGSGTESVAMLSPDVCALALGYNIICELQMTDAILDLTSKPPFLDQIDHANRQTAARKDYAQRAAALTRRELQQSLVVCHAALTNCPSDWWLHYNYGMLCQTAQDYAESAKALEQAATLMPHVAHIRMALAEALNKTSQNEAAIAQIKAVLKIDPQYPTAHQVLTEYAARRK